MQNFYELIDLTDKATTDQIRAVRFAPETDITDLLNIFPVERFDIAVQQLRHKAAQRDAAVMVLVEPFRREVYDWAFANYSELKPLNPEIESDADPLKWVGKSWDAAGVGKYPSLSQDDFWKKIEQIKEKKDRLSSNENQVTVDDLASLVRAFQISQETPEIDSAELYAASEILKARPDLAKEAHEKTGRYPFHYQMLMSAGMYPCEPAVRKLLNVWLKAAPAATQPAMHETLGYIVGRLPENNDKDRAGRSKIVGSIIEKWPALITAGGNYSIGRSIAAHCEQMPNDPAIRQLHATLKRVTPQAGL